MKNQLILNSVAVAFQTPDGILPVLRDLDLQIAAGSFVAIVGRNGSGKSTLAKVLSGLCPVSKGSVQVGEAGTMVRVQMMFQNPEAQIVGETVYEDVCFGLENLAVPPEEMPERALGALRQVGLEKRLEQPVGQLSGGQKQLLAIAGCLVMEPDVIVFDEATAMLDPAARQKVLHVVQTLHAQGKTILWVTQAMDELAFADRVVALEQGEIVYDGDNRGFFYTEQDNIDSSEQVSPCERLGFVPPYIVQVAQELQQKGTPMRTKPMSSRELAIELKRQLGVAAGAR